jgi:phenylalanyl-tRNA synthetase alpha chain
MNESENYGSELLINSINSLTIIDNQEELEEWRVNVLGRKGSVAELFKNISNFSNHDKGDAGFQANNVKTILTNAYNEKQLKILDHSASNNTNLLDVTLPGRTIQTGHLHPTTKIIREISEVFVNMGFEITEGPEVELDKYNFQKLNIPIDHPARDMWNTLWVDHEENGKPNLLLRTHTSPMQIRFMESNTPPIRVIVPGKTYRYEATDATHEWQFCQVEGLVVGQGITFADLKGTLEEFAKRIFGSKRVTRFRCDFFPFVEPGAEVSIDCFKCNGDGCKICSNTGWIEIMGAGMVHPKVLSGVGYDPDIYTGFAFGMGTERISMLKNGIDDVRLFYANDLRFLKQFV